MAIFLAEICVIVLTPMLTNRKNVIHGVAKQISSMSAPKGGRAFGTVTGGKFNARPGGLH